SNSAGLRIIRVLLHRSHATYCHLLLLRFAAGDCTHFLLLTTQINMENAAARRERLKALKQAAQLVESGGNDAEAVAAAPSEAQEAAAEQPAEKPMLKFRNYVVKDEKNIQHEKVAPAQPPQITEPELGTKPEDADEEELLASVAPKKANWDLKREVEPRLAKLERRTQRALVEMLLQEEQQQLQQEGGVAD
ncbi:cwf18 pre-mRNA splicing factor-domain-containing protein, partial [Scenedesmus sp. NREL 46B-D3]